MRAGPLSTSEAINALNRYFVPVASSNYEIGPEGQAPPAEKAERGRIYHDFYEKKLGIGDVHVYILRPDLTSFGGMDIGSALGEGKLAGFLEDVRKQLQIPAGPPAFAPHNGSNPPAAPDDAMVFHLVTRGEGHGAWREFPSENWIVLQHAEWSALLPPEPSVSANTAWTVPRAVSDKLLAWFYPQTEVVSELPQTRLDQDDLRITVTTIHDGVARARIEGTLQLVHAFYPKTPHRDVMNARLLGFMDFVPAEGRIQRLRIVSDKATYGASPFDGALRSVSRETLEAR